MECCRRGVLTLRASDFPYIFQRSASITDVVFASDPLCKLDATRRGNVIQRLVRQSFQAMYPSAAILDPPRGYQSNGLRRSGQQAEVDWVQDGRKVECKSTRVAFQHGRQCWRALWSSIKFGTEHGTPAFDDLVLVLHSPGNLHVIRHDHKTGVTRAGLQTECAGHQIICISTRGVLDVRDATQEIIRKLTRFPNACELVTTLRCESENSKRILEQELQSVSCRGSWDCYESTPLVQLSACSRALRLQELAYALDQQLHPTSIFVYGVGTESFAGVTQLQRRGAYRGSADWFRDHAKVEFKSSKLHWKECDRRWQVNFVCIKDSVDGSFDELLLGMYAPCAFYLFRSGYSASTGQRMSAGSRGRSICFSVPGHADCVPSAVESLLQKLQRAGCQLLGQVVW